MTSISCIDSQRSLDNQVVVLKLVEVSKHYLAYGGLSVALNETCLSCKCC